MDSLAQFAGYVLGIAVVIAVVGKLLRVADDWFGEPIVDALKALGAVDDWAARHPAWCATALTATFAVVVFFTVGANHPTRDEQIFASIFASIVLASWVWPLAFGALLLGRRVKAKQSQGRDRQKARPTSDH